MKMVIWGAVVFLVISITTIITGKWKEGLLIYAIAGAVYGVFLLIYAEAKSGEGVFHEFLKALKRGEVKHNNRKTGKENGHDTDYRSA